MARVFVGEGPAVLRGDSHDEIATQVERHIAKAEAEGEPASPSRLSRDPARIALAEVIPRLRERSERPRPSSDSPPFDVLPEDSRSRFAKKRAAVSTTAAP
jgi:hypothetical protein